MARLGAVELLLLRPVLAVSPHHEPSEDGGRQSPDAGGSGDPPGAVGDEHEDNAGRAEEGETDGGGEPGTGSESLWEQCAGLVGSKRLAATWSTYKTVLWFGRDPDRRVRERAGKAALPGRLQRRLAAGGGHDGRGRRSFEASLLGHHDLLARVDGVLAGSAHAALTPWRPDRLFLLPTVLPAQRGRGAGSALHAAASEWAREQGHETIEAVVAENYSESLAFANRRGFVEERRERGVMLDLDADRAARGRSSGGKSRSPPGPTVPSSTAGCTRSPSRRTRTSR